MRCEEEGCRVVDSIMEGGDHFINKFYTPNKGDIHHTYVQNFVQSGKTFYGRMVEGTTLRPY